MLELHTQFSLGGRPVEDIPVTLVACRRGEGSMHIVKKEWQEVEYICSGIKEEQLLEVIILTNNHVYEFYFSHDRVEWMSLLVLVYEG